LSNINSDVNRTCILQNPTVAQLVSKLTASFENRRFFSASSRTHSQLSLCDIWIQSTAHKPLYWYL